ncbi:MAG: hypothetical protein E7588_04995 [Ruminococcaceae bacterium]|nr:hypothetical protein [Oscillospiraceae bacterium]
MDLIKQLNGNLTEYQSIPFWSWNDKLKPEELRRQIRQMKEAGIGGFFMHARGGLQTEYLGEDWFECIGACIDEAKKQGMDAWCYDENGWPSGFAGMKLLENKDNWEHYVTCDKKPAFDNEAMYVYILKDNKLIRVTENCGAEEYICVYDKLNSSVVDILNPEVVQKFIDETHEKYYARFKEEFGNAMVGFFTDEPQFFRWDTAYTPMLIQAFKDEYNYDIADGMAYLFVDCDGAYEFRFRYWRLMNKLFTNNFIKRIYDWCEEHNCKITGHAVQETCFHGQMWCCAGVMPFYEYEHIPGIDWLGRDIADEVSPRQVSSVAQQLGKKHVLTETFACTGWDVLPKELKYIAEWQYVNGVNQTCQHLMPYSIRGQRKRDYPHHFSEHTPWFSEYRHFNDYFTRLGYMLSNSKEQVNVAVLHTLHSVYLTFKRGNDYGTTKEYNDPFGALGEKLGAAHILHHYIDELLLEKHGSVSDGKLKMGLCEYDTVVIPKALGLDSSTAKLLKEFIAQGGKIYIADQKPQYIDGVPADMDWLESNITYEQLINPDYKVDKHDTAVRATYRKSDFGDFIFTVNLDTKSDADLTYTVKAGGAKLFDAQTMEYKPVYFEKNGEYINIPLHFTTAQSYIIMLDNNAVSAVKPTQKKAVMTLDKSFKIKKRTNNSLTLDYVAISYDNVNFDEPMPVMAASWRLLTERKQRTVYLKYKFDVREMPGKIFVEAEDVKYKNVWINNRSIVLDKQGEIDRSFITANIENYVKPGINEIVFEIDYYQSEHVYYVMFDCKEGTESLRNCLTFDTDIEAIYIRGDFTVKADCEITDGTKATKFAENFYIASPNYSLDASYIPTEGYPFFAGEITLEKTFVTDEESLELELDGRFAFCEVILNGNTVKNLMFDNTCDLTGYLRKGENVLTLRLINGNRNLLGPFHVKSDPEPYGVGPGTFDRYYTWNGSQSPNYRDNYSFVKFGIDSIKLFK